MIHSVGFRFWFYPSLILFVLLLVQGATVGLTDDEAYYWVLAQKPALGYAFHPPAVAWLLAFVERIFSSFNFFTPTAGLVRLPAAFLAAGILGLALTWLKDTGVDSKDNFFCMAILVSFAGLFALSWMIVPDLPLFFGITLGFKYCWKVCSGSESGFDRAMIALGMTIAALSKYSGILAAGSAVLSILIWTKNSNRWRCIFWVLAGTAVGFLPALIWNFNHDWSSLLYQIRERHGDMDISFARYARFWLVEILLAGPVLMAAGIILLLKKGIRFGKEPSIYSYCLIWFLPAAAVFCFQPLFADFKPHWAFAAWWPLTMMLTWACAIGGKMIRLIGSIQAGYGIALVLLIISSTHFPLGSLAVEYVSGSVSDPKIDVTNDLYGWQDLKSFLEHKLGKEAFALPLVGSRYQTASQAAFNLRAAGAKGAQVTLLPRDIKARDEWPDFEVTDSTGPEWPRLAKPVLFVADNRYSSGPQFLSSKCEKIGRLEKQRWRYLAKWIDIWRCEPLRVN
ncbi:MAG: hypothetical protein AABZ06_02185 [Bdellovibrionota bacterium]